MIRPHCVCAFPFPPPGLEVVADNGYRFFMFFRYANKTRAAGVELAKNRHDSTVYNKYESFCGPVTKKLHEHFFQIERAAVHS